MPDTQYRPPNPYGWNAPFLESDKEGPTMKKLTKVIVKRMMMKKLMTKRMPIRRKPKFY